MTYPSNIPESIGACIASIKAGSPAAEAGLEPGMIVECVDSQPLMDILDWYWLSDESSIELETRANGSFFLAREPGESWGISFSEVLFDGLRRCVNTCSFCFMRMLPMGMRPALYVRDDDYRLSFLQGNFVTLTNLTDEDIERIITMRLSPLNVSLHVIDSQVRKLMIGANEARGIAVLEELLAAGISFKAQIVLMPDVNDGEILEQTLEWIMRKKGISVTGVVPYGYTSMASVQKGFDTAESAQKLIQQIEHLAPQIQLADEFYVKAWPGELLAHLPATTYYEDYPMLEDGIGLLRRFIDECVDTDKNNHRNTGLALKEEEVLVTGKAFALVLKELWSKSASSILAVSNEFFGGNVDVAGLLTAQDIIKQASHLKGRKLLLPPAMFNDDGLTLDGQSVNDIEKALNVSVKVLDFTYLI